ncbi:Multidrug and toxin extrusion protein 1 [Phytophthora ramorum]|uniref:Multidrug and toxin extrusion protein 1 n=1 Tax=Phytophthora ramorum TaxID=164328 RepID=UPI0030A0434A|nr:Multidrug and toxin extrusion protein 1 [Phytophthora ramorum]
MGMTIANVGEDDSAGESDSSGSSGSSSGNSGLIRNHPSAASRTKDQAKRRYAQPAADAAGTAYEKPKAKRGDAKPARKVKLQPLTVQDAKPKKKSAMTRQFSSYGTLRSTKADPPADAPDETSWKSNVEKWTLEAHEMLSPRGAVKIKKQLNGSNRNAAARLRANFRSGVLSEESGDDSETSTSSYSSSNSSDSPVAIPIRSSSFSAVDQWESKVRVSKPINKAHKVTEELPLLQSYTRDSETDIESGILLEEPESDALPEIKTEVRKLFKLAYPVIFTYVLEFFPELVSMTLVGHLDSPLTKQYLDGVALSTINLVNLLLGVYLTFYTPLGFDGAAIARLLSELVLPLCLIPYFMSNPHIPAEWWPGWQTKEAVHHLGTFLTLGIPGMFMMLLEWWSFEIMAAVVGWLPNSVTAISVHSVLVNVSTFAFNFFLGISVAANVLVGNYSGSNKPHHAKMVSMLGMVLSVSLSAVLAVFIIATRYYIPEIFINDAVSIGLAGHALLFLMPYQMCDAVNAVMQGVFRGTGRLMLGAYINLFAYFVIGLPFGVYLAFRMEMGVEGMWLGLTAGIFFGCVVSFIKICETNWKSMADAASVRTS